MVIEELDNREKCDTETMCFDRYKMFLKQYKEWVDANEDILEEESYKVLS